MRETEISILRNKILDGDFHFIDVIYKIVKENKVLLSDNYGEVSKEEEEAISYLEPFMHLLYRGSKHSIGRQCESGFKRVIKCQDSYLEFTYYDGPFTFVEVVEIDDVKNVKPLITMELLQKRIKEQEDVKSELSPIVEKYLTAGLTIEEITNIFVYSLKEEYKNFKRRK